MCVVDGDAPVQGRVGALVAIHTLAKPAIDADRRYAERGMAGYVELQRAEFASEADGYTATRHQREVGTGYFDAVTLALSGGKSSTMAMGNSTETGQFHDQGQTAVAAE